MGCISIGLTFKVKLISYIYETRKSMLDNRSYTFVAERLAALAVSSKDYCTTNNNNDNNDDNTYCY